MAAIVQENIRKFESFVQPYVKSGPLDPLFKVLEEKTKVRREQYALGFIGLLAIYLIGGWGNDVLANIIGYLYPAYASLLALEATNNSKAPMWLLYWVIYGSMGMMEYVLYDLFQSILIYWLLKVIFLLWLMVPGENGGTRFLFSRIVRPYILKSSNNVRNDETKNY